MDNNGKETVTFQTTSDQARHLRIRAAELAITRSEGCREASDLWLHATVCPQCGELTTKHPDPLMTGVRWCPHCQEAVGFQVLAAQ